MLSTALRPPILRPLPLLLQLPGTNVAAARKHKHTRARKPQTPDNEAKASAAGESQQAVKEPSYEDYSVQRLRNEASFRRLRRGGPKPLLIDLLEEDDRVRGIPSPSIREAPRILMTGLTYKARKRLTSEACIKARREGRVPPPRTPQPAPTGPLRPFEKRTGRTFAEMAVFGARPPAPPKANWEEHHDSHQRRR